MRITVRVPATSANLGPGFDCFGLALDLCNEVSAEVGPAQGWAPGVEWEGEGASELATDGTDMVSRAMRFVADRAGAAMPPLRLRSVNRIPLERGLGSSSAAAVAGVALAAAVLEDRAAADPQAVFEAASELEGHPDNAAAAVFGGLTIAVGDGGVPVRLDPHPALHPVVLVPREVRLPTDRARRALGETVSRRDAIFNIQRSALAVVALTRDPSLLARALDDRLHQQDRLALVPPVRAVFEELRDRGVPVCVSGAGPALLAFASEGRPVGRPGVGWPGADWEAWELAPRGAGFEVEHT